MKLFIEIGLLERTIIAIRSVFQGICYLTDIENVETARIIWEETTNNSIMDYVVVTKLPKNALIEWHVWGHIHNNQFECECLLNSNGIEFNKKDSEVTLTK